MERYATNLARWDLLLYFGQHPSAMDGVSGIARNIGRRARSVMKELDDLVYLGVLNALEQDNGIVYQLAPTPSTRRAVIRMAERYRQ